MQVPLRFAPSDQVNQAGGQSWLPPQGGPPRCSRDDARTRGHRQLEPTHWRITSSAAAVQARLRHASANTTLDTYGHLWPDRDETRAAVQAGSGIVRTVQAAE
jgi:integrase